ncbi:MAG: hypothetical protein PVI43_00095 [Candidatus Bathyarchaeota archaeon]|jgi:hypothetical protein
MAYCDCVGEFNRYERLRYWKLINACDMKFIEAMIDKRSIEAARAAAKAKAKQKLKPR